jgi:hypothetical protein
MSIKYKVESRKYKYIVTSSLLREKRETPDNPTYSK